MRSKFTIYEEILMRNKEIFQKIPNHIIKKELKGNKI